MEEKLCDGYGRFSFFSEKSSAIFVSEINGVDRDLNLYLSKIFTYRAKNMVVLADGLVSYSNCIGE